MINVSRQTEMVEDACRVKDLDSALVKSVRITKTDVYLVTDDGEVRVERSALSACQDRVRDELRIPGVPSNTLAVLVEAGYTTLAGVGGASDEALLDLPGVGKATLKRIRLLEGG